MNFRNDPIEEYWLTTVNYGEAAVPFMAVSVLKQWTIEFENEDTGTANVVKNDFYMNGLLWAVDTEEATAALKPELTELVKYGEMESTKWTSISEIVVNQDPDFESPCGRKGVNGMIRIPVGFKNNGQNSMPNCPK